MARRLGLRRVGLARTLTALPSSLGGLDPVLLTARYPRYAEADVHTSHGVVNPLTIL
jgi:hypothetical protein